MTAARCWRPGCHHTRDEHTHYRPGLDCALCTCPRFRRWPRPADWWFLAATTWSVLRAIP